jgi:hypothetical protein
LQTSAGALQSSIQSPKSKIGNRKSKMAYAPAYPNSLFTKPLLNQLIAIIQRDQQAALQVVNGSLVPITEFHKGPGARTAFPWLTLAADSVAFDRQAGGTRCSQARVTLTLEVGQFDQEMAEDNAQDYARTLDMVVTSASLSDFSTALPIVHETVPAGVTTPSAPGAVQDVFVESHHYGQVTLPGIEVPVLRVTVAVRFDLEET